MTRLTAAAALWTIALGAVPGPQESVGTIPAAFGSPSRITWIAADDTQQGPDCTFRPPNEWGCSGLPPQASGVVVLVGERSIFYVPVGVGDGEIAGALASWGRVVSIMAGGASPDDLHDLRLAGWKPERSSVRRQTQRLAPIEDPTVHVLRLSDTTFWLTGRGVERDGFVRIDGPAIASMRISSATIADGPPEIPFYTSAVAPVSIVGRVQTRRDQGVDGADVELLEPLALSETRDRRLQENAPLIRRAKARTEPDGTFRFQRLEPGPYQVLATHPTLGRGAAWITTLREPVIVKLTPPARASGRVLRRGLPVSIARVRFVPNAAAWTASVDPFAHIVDDVYSDTDGRFVLTLPPQATGTVQVIAPDGASVRIPLSSFHGVNDIVLGDVALPDLRRAVVRLVDPVNCDLFAVGPLGTLGLTIVRATSSSNVSWFELPEAGTWVLDAECSGRNYSLEPPSLNIAPHGGEPSIDVRIVKSPRVP